MACKKLVIAVDISKDCLKALDFALEHFPTGYKYNLVHMLPRPHISSVAAGAVTPEYAFESVQAKAKEMTAVSNKFMEEVFVSKARSAGICVLGIVLKISSSNSSGHIGAAICEYAEKNKGNALIMMRNNKSSMERFFMGSVTRYCAVHSPIPVIVVPNHP
ncbi:g5188 [Coccomyxa elongata]